jgi:hypothetical protein
MLLIHNTPLTQAMRLWIYAEYLVKKLTWWLTVFTLSHTYAKSLHKIVLPFLKKWTGIPRGGNSDILFCGSETVAGLKLPRIHTVYKAMQVVKLRILKDSADSRSTYIHQATLDKETSSSSNRFTPALALTSILALQTDIRPPPARQGLGYKQHIRQVKTTAYQYFASLDNQAQQAHLDKLFMQGKWTHFDDIVKSDWSWNKLLYNCTDRFLKFLVNAPNNSLPTPDNLHRWSGCQLSVNCALCGNHRPTLPHVLSGCYTALHQGRYTWRHDCILQIIYQGIQSTVDGIRESRTAAPVRDRPYIQFVPKVGEHVCLTRPPRRTRPPAPTGLLHRAKDWQFAVDLPDFQYQFPESIAVTSQRPDILIYSYDINTAILIELTVPWEDNVSAAALRKEERYEKLIADIVGDWHVHFWTIEVGCRGYCSQSLKKCFRDLGLENSAISKLRRIVVDTVQRCSYIIYSRRNNNDWTTPVLKPYRSADRDMQQQ